MPTNVLNQNIITDLGIDQLPKEKQEEIIMVMGGIILKRITLRILESLPEAKRKEFDEVCASGDQEKVTKFFEQNIPGYQQMIEEEAEKFKKEMKEMVDSFLS